MMHTLDDRFVPKVHPLQRGVQPEDPYELMAEPVQGDPSVMLECILQEFLCMGWSREQLLELFQSPHYPVLCQLRQVLGEAEVVRQVDSLVATQGVMRFRETIAEPEVDEEKELELVQLTLFSSIASDVCNSPSTGDP